MLCDKLRTAKAVAFLAGGVDGGLYTLSILIQGDGDVHSQFRGNRDVEVVGEEGGLAFIVVGAVIGQVEIKRQWVDLPIIRHRDGLGFLFPGRKLPGQLPNGLDQEITPSVSLLHQILQRGAGCAVEAGSGKMQIGILGKRHAIGVVGEVRHRLKGRCGREGGVPGEITVALGIDGKRQPLRRACVT